MNCSAHVSCSLSRIDFDFWHTDISSIYLYLKVIQAAHSNWPRLYFSLISNSVCVRRWIHDEKVTCHRFSSEMKWMRRKCERGSPIVAESISLALHSPNATVSGNRQQENIMNDYYLWFGHAKHAIVFECWRCVFSIPMDINYVHIFLCGCCFYLLFVQDWSRSATASEDYADRIYGSSRIRFHIIVDNFQFELIGPFRFHGRCAIDTENNVQPAQMNWKCRAHAMQTPEARARQWTKEYCGTICAACEPLNSLKMQNELELLCAYGERHHRQR